MATVQYQLQLQLQLRMTGHQLRAEVVSFGIRLSGLSASVHYEKWGKTNEPSGTALAPLELAQSGAHVASGAAIAAA